MNGGTLQWGGTNTYDISSSTGGLKINDGVTGTFDTNGNNVTFAAAIKLGTAKTDALTKIGARHADPQRSEFVHRRDDHQPRAIDVGLHHQRQQRGQCRQRLENRQRRFYLNSNATAASTQTFGGLTVNAGVSTITLQNNSLGVTLNLGTSQTTLWARAEHRSRRRQHPHHLHRPGRHRHLRRTDHVEWNRLGYWHWRTDLHHRTIRRLR